MIESISSRSVSRVMKGLSTHLKSESLTTEQRAAMGEAWRTLAALASERNQLRRGEFICKRCGLRKDDEHPKTHEF